MSGLFFPTQGLAIELNQLEVEAFFDGLISAQINQNRIPGAVVSLVQDGELIFSKGYGYSNIEAGTPVNPETTLFRPGSVSKLFTWTAVMQLVEQGEIDLDEDINNYLDFNIPGEQAITMRHLMTHTPGFEDVGEGLFVLSETEMLSLGDCLKEYQPARVFEAGEVMAYSNYATGLAGYIVELVSDMDFEDYVEENIFQPLNMNNSTFRQPLPDNLSDDLANAYKYAGGQYHQGEFEYMSNNAAGAMNTTANDIANFMIAHLQQGSFGDSRILQEETALEMHNYHFTHHPEIEGMALGFARDKINGEQIIAHTGATTLYFSGLYLIPEHDIGLFVSYSGGDPMQISKFFNSFMDQYFPEEVSGISGNDPGRINDAYVGEYHPTRRNFNNQEKIIYLFQRGRVDVSEDGFLKLNIYGNSLQLGKIETGLFQNQNHHGGQLIDQVAFLEDEEHGILMITGGPGVFQKVDWYESSLVLGGITGLILLLSIWMISISIRNFLVDKIFREKLSRVDKRGITGALILLASISIVVFIAGSVNIFTSINPAYGVPDIFFGEISGFGEIIYMLPYLITGLIGLILIFTLQSWVKRNKSLFSRLNYTIYTLAGLGFIWVLYYLNLL